MAISNGHGGDALAPVTYLPGVAPQNRGVVFAESSRADDTFDGGSTPNDEEFVDRASLIDSASVSLTRSLGRRGLSVAEARAKLRSSGLTGDEIDGVIDDFERRQWLDDAMLAEQLVHSATTRQDMGTKAVKQLLQKRLVAREVIEAVIAELPDDDAQRAMEFATSKARSLVRYDDDTAIRRLMGQLARRGFGGGVAGHAARTALAEARKSAAAGGVRFR
ncbi:regulatory protein RecX [Microbacterium rhizomatis]|uniref:Regulatory protein RecX n=1 Tax=Microbacterium rhizomatis TaxID=1631477 RepID=A0A5J5J454_9MICO|nr:regulatory protein RecX [Microbacterium rhizomatis]KAA9111027.1 regulatory protein RecX [Microbacterium rhizomatis]